MVDIERSPSLLSIECSMLKMMKDEVWERLMKLKKAFPEDYKEVNAKNCW